MTTSPHTLVLGGTGKTGRRIVQRLQAGGLASRVGSRHAHPAFDWDDRSTWPATLDGVDAAYVAYQPDLAVPGAAETVAALTELAVSQGVRRLVLLSGRGEPEAQRCEQLVRAAFSGATVVRSSWFNQNFSESYLLDGVLAGQIVLPAGDVLEPFVDAEDIADVAVAALTEDRHAGETYELTGPRLLTFADAAKEIALATGREVNYVPVPIEEYASMLAAHGVPDDVAGLLTYLFAEVLDGRNAHLSHGVERALGRAPRDFTGYARRAAATGVWTPR